MTMVMQSTAKQATGSAKVLPGSSVIGCDVRNPKGEDLGKIEDLMIDASRGYVAYAVLSFGGFLGMGNKLFAVPWGRLAMDAENEQCILDADKEFLKNAPGFDKNKWPDMADNSWSTSVYSYYKVDRPNW